MTQVPLSFIYDALGPYCRKLFWKTLYACLFMSTLCNFAASQDCNLAFPEVVLIKIGGSSITNKGFRETVDTDALDWFAKTLANSISPSFREHRQSEDDPYCRQTAFIVVHGAGSFGHHHAKEFGLKGQSEPPSSHLKQDEDARLHLMHGLAQTRLSVQKLNRLVVSALVNQGLNAVGISPCFSVPSIQAHGGGEQAVADLLSIIRTTLAAGLIPVLHGDACLYGEQGAGILSGDTLMEMLGQAPWISKAIFITDVDGVFTKDPRGDPNAELLTSIEIDSSSGDLVAIDVEASGSTHEHDVTGGLKTKLASAASIVGAGKNVTIVKCGSESAEKAIRQEDNIFPATVLFQR